MGSTGGLDIGGAIKGLTSAGTLGLSEGRFFDPEAIIGGGITGVTGGLVQGEQLIGGLRPDLPPPAGAPGVPTQDTAAQEAEQRRKERSGRRGRRANILTSPLGRTGSADIQRARLLGQ